MDGENLSEFEKAQQQLQALDIEVVMGTENGRRFIWRILEYCGIYRDIDGDRSDMLKQIGNRQAGLYILGIVSDIAEDQVFKMMKEAKNRSVTEEEYYDERDRNNRDSDDSGNEGGRFETPRGDINLYL